MSENYIENFNRTCNELNEIFNGNLSKNETIEKSKKIIDIALKEISDLKIHSPLESKVLIEIFYKKLNSLKLPYPTELKYRRAIIYFAYDNYIYEAKELFEDILKNETNDSNWKELSSLYLLKIFDKFLDSEYGVIDINYIKSQRDDIFNYFDKKNKSKNFNDSLVRRSWHEEMVKLNNKIDIYDKNFIVITNSTIYNSERNLDLSYLIEKYDLVIDAKSSPLYKVFFFKEEIYISTEDITLLLLIIKNYSDFEIIKELDIKPRVSELKDKFTKIKEFIDENKTFNSYEFDDLFTKNKKLYQNQKKEIEKYYSEYLKDHNLKHIITILNLLIKILDKELEKLEKFTRDILQQKISRLKSKLREVNPKVTDAIIRENNSYKISIRSAILGIKDLEMDYHR